MMRVSRLFSIFTPVNKTGRSASWPEVFRIASVSLLLFSLLLPAAFAFGWAVGKIVHLPDFGIYFSEALFTAPMLVACMFLVRLAYEAETGPHDQENGKGL